VWRLLWAQIGVQEKISSRRKGSPAKQGAAQHGVVRPSWCGAARASRRGRLRSAALLRKRSLRRRLSRGTVQACCCAGMAMSHLKRRKAGVQPGKLHGPPLGLSEGVECRLRRCWACIAPHAAAVQPSCGPARAKRRCKLSGPRIRRQIEAGLQHLGQTSRPDKVRRRRCRCLLSAPAPARRRAPRCRAVPLPLVSRARAAAALLLPALPRAAALLSETLCALLGASKSSEEEKVQARLSHSDGGLSFLVAPTQAARMGLRMRAAGPRTFLLSSERPRAGNKWALYMAPAP
jgi:hypothetical protein